MAIDERGPHSLRALLRPAADPPMRDPQRTREQAAQALRRAGEAIDELRAQAASDPAPETRLRNQQLRVLTRQLSHRYHWLAELHRSLAAGDDAELARAWSRFFACYDDFLEALRQARTELDERAQPAPAPPSDRRAPDDGEG
ncbi:hypothetical protein K4L06_16375 [Lysobacter sp. BMK333-48F3]|uniref:hypothetical protein n=1 Tax=Lysobacter sp. BMK333-48F3 TaxID=2867962 RepID=UPI001C8B5551|nr:hypothetical protein [Lysobacter sp. BMK333-48F3]MBX9402887.1 hypothetical protein [Lysobacter sp. BMK333-48F3]